MYNQKLKEKFGNDMSVVVILGCVYNIKFYHNNIHHQEYSIQGMPESLTKTKNVFKIKFIFSERLS